MNPADDFSDATDLLAKARTQKRPNNGQIDWVRVAGLTAATLFSVSVWGWVLFLVVWYFRKGH